MNTLLLSLATVVLYLVVAVRLGATLGRGAGTLPLARGLQGTLMLTAVLLHGIVLYQDIVTPAGLDLGIFNAASLVAWIMVLFLLTAALQRPLDSLAVIVLPAAALVIALELVIPSTRIIPDRATWGLQIHILLSVLAYSLLAIAALQALLVAVEDHYLRQKRPLPVMHWLPPLQVMESLLFQLIGLGFVLLSFSLLSGFMFLEDLFGQHLVHKTVLSLIAWLAFAVLLWGRWHFGWRGRTAIRYTLGGFVCLMLAYFGSKVVLELILQRT